jgi:spermidine/putrescine transport system substrate-binding protein
MAHPKDRPGLSRRRLLQGAAGGALGVGALGALAGCQNTTTPVGACDDGGSELVVAKPSGPGGLPLPRPDNSVTWAITDDNQAIADGLDDEGGPLQVYNYADYLDPALVKRFEGQTGRKVKIATYNSADEAVAKLAAGAVGFDVIVGLSGSNVVHLIAQQLLQPLNHSYLPNLEKNVWPALQDPFYDRGSRYTVPSSSGRTGSAGATTRSRRRSPAWTFRGTSSGPRSPTAARWPCSTTSGTRSRCRSSGTRCARVSGPT